MILVLLITSCAASQSAPAFSIIADRQSYAVGDTMVLSLDVSIPRNYHLYGNPLGPGIGKPLVIYPTKNGSIKWIGINKLPAKKFTPEIGGWVWAYETHTRFFIKGIVLRGASGRIFGIVSVNGLICSSNCIPFLQDVSFSVVIGESFRRSFGGSIETLKDYQRSEPMLGEISPFVASVNTQQSALAQPFSFALKNERVATFDTTSVWDYDPVVSVVHLNLLLALLFGFIAGIILNFMPCVFPVLGIKILSFTKGGQENRRTALLRSLAFAGGIMTVFMVLASLAAFMDYSWGEHFQNTGVRIGIILFIVMFGLGMFGMFQIVLPSSFGNLVVGQKHNIAGDFGRGVFATILATPCSGPFLGGTLAWTLSQSTIVVFVVFAAVGIGMSLPYVLLTISSPMRRMIPRPGQWMSDFEHAMGFLLLGFAAYLLFGLTADLAAKTVLTCIFLAIGIGVYGRFAPFGSTAGKRAFAGIAGAAIIFLGLQANFNIVSFLIDKPSKQLDGQLQPLVWEEFSKEALLRAHADGRHVIVDFTANWCMNCQYNMVAVLKSEEVKKIANQKNILLLSADLTDRNPAAESLLHHLGSRSVPFLAIFPGDDPYHPIVMRDILDKNKLVIALEKLAEK